MAEVTQSPGTVVDDATVGTVAWSNPDNAKVSDDVYATAPNLNGGVNGHTIRDETVKIVKSDGTFGTTNKATLTNIPSVDTYVSYGGSADLWGETWTSTDINDVDFGMVISFKGNTLNTISHYLKATNFGFTIPAGATINGILVEVERKNIGGTTVYVDHIRITVYYTTTYDSPFPSHRRIT